MALCVLTTSGWLQAQDAGQILYGKPFSDDSLKDWMTVSGKWDLVQENGSTFLHTDSSGGLSRITVGSADWADYSVEVKTRIDKWFSDKAGDYGIIVRYVDPANYYLFLYDSNPSVKALIIQKKVGNKLITLAKQPFAYETGHWYTFKGIVKGNDLEFDVDGQKVLTASASEIPKGPAGFLAWLVDAKFDAVQVKPTGP